MKATRNKDGTIDLTGLSEKNAFGLMVLVGNTRILNDVTCVWGHLNPLFPKFMRDNVWNKFKILKESIVINEGEFEKAFASTTEFPVPAQPVKAQSNQRRDANGRFAKKVWVARFDYPDSNHPWVYVRRTVLTNLNGKRNPIIVSNSIEGKDLARNGEFRKFSLNKIINGVQWKKEYASDLI